MVSISKAKRPKRELVLLDVPETEQDEEPVEQDLSQTPRGEVSDWLDDKKFTDYIQWEGFIIVEAQDAADKHRRYSKVSKYSHTIPTRTFIIIINMGFNPKSADLDKMLGKISNIKSQTRDFNADIIIISEKPLTVFSKKKLSSYLSAGSDTAGYVSVIDELFTLFMSDLFERKSMAKHRILSIEEEEIVLKDLCVTKQSLQKIATNDAACVILGAVAGDLLEIIAFNENTAKDLKYRVTR